jgi:hypothetical protein
MTETQQRFLRSIAQRLPMEQVVEVHLFPPIRQGGVETGVAVVAEDPRHPVAAVAEPVVTDASATQADGIAELAVDAQVDGVAEPDETSDEGDEDESDDDDSPYAEDGDDVVAGEANDLDDSEPDSVEPEPQADGDGIAAADVVAPPAPRFIIHTARYRLTLKGVDRGKWEVDVVAEADAPLDALDKVIRGVQRRAGEGAEPDRLTSDAFREALEAPLASLER